ncbi:hypothetical protein AMJ52_07585 [candidate division TA06 bacterium DG_78]|uniref:Uncharacterized protein n=1 Tax=candidate division TA06 bacterium DG_78 TaxID=1703772 RepID=A0A0S7YCA1_UNCT6|nr:MAG: hypothetical protein AMJ52_07585 [candidate division TA06 bacterium DG_78]
MKKLVIPIIFLIFLMCTEDISRLDFDFEHATTVLKLQSAILGEKEQVYINIMVTFILTQPPGEGIVIERSIGDSTSFAAIDTVLGVNQYMSYTDEDTLLEPSSTVYYRLGFLENSTVDYFTTEKVDVPGSQLFYEPSEDTLGDTLRIVFAQVSGFSDCDIALYEFTSAEPESLLNLVDPLFDTTLTYPNDTCVVYLPDSDYPDSMVYTIRISSSQSLPLITDTSVGFRAFLKE